MTDLATQKRNEPEVAYRRNNAWEAFRLFLVTFALATIFHVAWDAAFEDAINFEGSFWRSLAFSAAFALSSMLIKFTPVHFQ